MEEPIEQKKCDNHKEINIAFYCFDDNSFLCSKCFKEHKKHNIEIPYFILNIVFDKK